MAWPSGRPGGHVAPAKAVRSANAHRQIASVSHGRGGRLPHPAGSRPDTVPAPGQLRLGARASHCLITGPCGTGKTFIACALGDKACRDNLSVLYQRSSRLFGALALARGDGRYPRLMRQLARVNLLILDDWGPEPLNAEQRRDLLE